MNYSITRQEIVEAAREMLGAPYLHQGRNLETGIDCVGLLVLIGQKINYPFLKDLEGYRRVPSSSQLIELLDENMDEIPLEGVLEGDIYLMRMGGIKPRHTAVCASTEYDLLRGKEPSLIHSLNNGQIKRVVEQPVSIWKRQFVKGYRVRGLV